jgi:hypothetical protein
MDCVLWVWVGKEEIASGELTSGYADYSNKMWRLILHFNPK